MLVRYRLGYEKIAMGMISLMASEKEIGKLRYTIQTYQQDSAYKLYLWKEAEDVVGIIGFREEENKATILHLSVNPSHRGQGIAKAMVNEVVKLYSELLFKGNEYTSSFVENSILGRIVSV